MKAGLSPLLRQTRRVLSQEKQEKRSIAIQAIDESLNDLTDQINILFEKDKAFQKEAEDIINQLVPEKSKILVRTTWGPNDSNVNEYTGVFTKNYGKGLFNIRTEERGEFSIGSSLCYIEVIS